MPSDDCTEEPVLGSEQQQNVPQLKRLAFINKRSSLRKRSDGTNKGRNLMTTMGERNDTIFDRNTVFHAIFDGKKVKRQ